MKKLLFVLLFPISAYADPFIFDSCLGDVSVTSVSARSSLPAYNPSNPRVVTVYLAPTVDTYVNFGVSSTATVGANLKLPAGSVQTFTTKQSWSDISYVSSTSGTMNICYGTGE